MQARVYSYARVSTVRQLAGDGLRRQMEAAEKWAAEHGLVLDETLRLVDRGKSAFKGVNRHKGALARLLEKLEDGTIPKGSFLLIESLDRLSRQDLVQSIPLFTSIVSAGLNVVTLMDGKPPCGRMRRNTSQS